METDNTKKKKSVRIPCAKIVVDYTKATLKRLGNLSCTNVYRSMKNDGGIVLQSHAKAVDDVDRLIKCTDTFLPSVPMTSKDVEDSRRFIGEWKKNLVYIRKQLTCTCKPVYLYTEVEKALKERKSKVKFHEVMLEWYLSRYGGDELTPEKIADAVLAHEGTDWKKVRPLAKGKNGYNIRLDEDTKEEKKVALKYIQWIYKLETVDVSATLLDDIANDIKVVKEFEAWRDCDPKDYEYTNTYKEYISRLRTAPKVEGEQRESAPEKDKTRCQYQAATGEGGVSQTGTSSMPSHAAAGDGQTVPQNVVTPSAGGGASPGTNGMTHWSESGEDIHQRNHTEMMNYLNTLAPRVQYLEGNLTEGRNPEYIRKFAHREDFREVFNRLKEHTAGAYVRASTVMQFIRNVANYNILEWGVPAPAQ